MPQMSPMNWSYLFLMFLALSLVLSNKVYFYLLKEVNCKSDLIKGTADTLSWQW